MKHLKNERGSALIIALLMVVLLSVIGLMSVRTASVETRITTNDKLQKNAFHQAEGGLHVAKELIEESIDNLGWTNGQVVRNVKVINGGFYSNSSLNGFANDTGAPDATFPIKDSDGTTVTTLAGDNTTVTTTKPHTNLKFGSLAQLTTGSGIEMNAGYEGLSKGSAQGGSQIVYTIRSQYQDGNSMGRLSAQWVHVDTVKNE